MALIRCVECSAEVSSAAYQCPRCGYPIAAGEKPSGKKAGKGKSSGWTWAGCWSLIGLIVLILLARALFRGGVRFFGEALNQPTMQEKVTETPDQALMSRILGTWAERMTTPDGGVGEARTSYMAGGVMNFSGTAKKGQEETDFIASGTWAVIDGHLHVTVQASNRQEVLPNGFRHVERIISVTDTQLTAVDAEGKKSVATRVR